MQKLTKAEEDVMQLIWELGRATVSDLLEKMEEPRPPHSTVSSVVRILERKAYVDHKAYGKTYEYFPLIAKEAYGRRSLTEVLSNYFDGSVSRLVSHLVEDKKLSERDMQEIMKKLNEKS
jgi:predicted transcriptional regulator